MSTNLTKYPVYQSSLMIFISRTRYGELLYIWHLQLPAKPAS